MFRSSLSIVFLLSVLLCAGQTKDNYEPYKSSDYSGDQYLIKLDTASFSKFKIEIRQVKALNQSIWDSSSFYCRGWITVKEGEKVIVQKYFRSIEPVGGCFGLFLPDKQPVRNYFIFSKFGDYDGSIFILDNTGTLIEKPGGIFYISDDQRYLFSNYDSDVAGLTVFDFMNNRLLYSEIDELTAGIEIWYFQNGKYFATTYGSNHNKNESGIKIATYDFKTNKLIFSIMDKSRLKTENQLKVYNDYQFAKECNCGH